MKKIFLLCSVLVWSIATLFAAPVSPQAAAQKAKALMARLAPSTRTGLSLKLDYTYTPASAAEYGIVSSSKSLGNTPFFYVFNRGKSEGYILIAADDRLPESIAYSAQGRFVMEDMPDNLRYWLSYYDSQINAVLMSAESPMLSNSSRTEGVPESVPAILETGANAASPILWDQGYPWNTKEPKLSNGKNAFTGCVATAMAMIMKHHNWPDKSEGTYNYTDYLYGNNVDYSGSFGKSYEWNNMPGTPSTPVAFYETIAYSDFMFDCSMSVEMQFGLNGSGTYSQYVVRALRENFKYQKSTRLEGRWMYGAKEWEDMIRREIAANRPIYYSGDDESTGHAFVCDGYDAQGAFHFNWGWSGVSNGYYRLTLLKPENLGIGGGGGAFTTNQYIVVGIMPAKTAEELAIPNAAPQVALYRMPSLKKQDDGVKARINFGNYGDTQVKFDLAYRIKKADSNEAIYTIGEYDLSWETSYSNEVADITISLDKLGVGRNEVTLITRRTGTDDNSWVNLRAHNFKARNPFFITLDEAGNTSFEFGPYQFNLTMPEGGLVGEFIQKRRCDIELTILNDQPNELRSRTEFALIGEDGKRYDLNDGWIMCEFAPDNANNVIKFTTKRLTMPLGMYKLQYKARDYSNAWKTLCDAEVKSPTSIDDAINNDSMLQVHPSKSDSYVTAKIPMGSELLQVFDTLGRLHKSVDVTNMNQVQIDMSNWNSGMYLFVIKGSMLDKQDAVKVIRK